MKELTKNEKVANIFSFLALLFGEDAACYEKIMEFSPDYLIEKFERYVESSRVEYPWGMHPSLRRSVFNVYMDKWNVSLPKE